MTDKIDLTTQMQEIIAILDQALISDTPAVISALQNLILVASISQQKSTKVGPYEKLTKQVNQTERMIDELHRRLHRLEEVVADYSSQRARNSYYEDRYRYDWNDYATPDNIYKVKAKYDQK